MRLAKFLRSPKHTNLVTFHALTIDAAKLWVFRDRTERAAAELAYDSKGVDATGFRTFQAASDHQIHESRT